MEPFVHVSRDSMRAPCDLRVPAALGESRHGAAGHGAAPGPPPRQRKQASLSLPSCNLIAGRVFPPRNSSVHVVIGIAVHVVRSASHVVSSSTRV